jgi:signal transduction histidine kinase
MAALYGLDSAPAQKARWNRRSHDRRQPVGSASAQARPGKTEVADTDVDATVEALRRRLLRVAFDVHDGPMQDLIAVGYGLNALRMQVAAAVGEERVASIAPAFDDLLVQLSATERTLRSMMFSLEKNAASRTDLLEIVAHQTAAFRRHSDVEVEVISEGDLELYTDSQWIAVERILLESLSNIAKHADATSVTIRLRGTSESFLVQVQDDGRGFVPHTSRRAGSNHVGLGAMRKRLGLLGGTFDVDSRPGGPTTVTATIEKWRPIEEGQSAQTTPRKVA